jgi:hypothetical protein
MSGGTPRDTPIWKLEAAFLQSAVGIIRTMIDGPAKNGPSAGAAEAA